MLILALEWLEGACVVWLMFLRAVVKFLYHLEYVQNTEFLLKKVIFPDLHGKFG